MHSVVSHSLGDQEVAASEQKAEEETGTVADEKENEENTTTATANPGM
jgi:hypothetical protein